MIILAECRDIFTLINHLLADETFGKSVSFLLLSFFYLFLQTHSSSRVIACFTQCVVVLDDVLSGENKRHLTLHTKQTVFMPNRIECFDGSAVNRRATATAWIAADMHSDDVIDHHRVPRRLTRTTITSFPIYRIGR